MATWLRAWPEVELHLHLEGAIPPPALWRLLEKYGGDAAVPDLAALRRRLTYKNFPDFIAAWIWKNRFIRSYDDFTFIAEAVARDLAALQAKYPALEIGSYPFYRPGGVSGRGGAWRAAGGGWGTAAGPEVAVVVLVVSRSSRLIPGLRGMPAVITTT